MSPPAIAPTDVTSPRLRVAVARPLDSERRAAVVALILVAMAMCTPEPEPSPDPEPQPRPLPGPRGQT